MGYVLLHRDKHDSYRRSFNRVEEVLEHQPETWLKYQHTPHGLFDIVEMEYSEYMKDMHNRTHQETLVALEHLAASAIYALHKMSCK